MSDERWRRVEELFAEAAELPPAERPALLAHRAAGDDALRSEVESLLAAAATTGPLDEIDSWLGPVRRGLGPDPLPERLGPYRVEAELGRGGMGIVYRAFDPRLERAVAVKVLYPHLAADTAMVERFVAEARAASRLDHRHVCTVHDLGRLDDGRMFIAMTWCAGGSLAERLADGPLPVDEAVRIALQVADGLRCLHDAGLVHRDVKPANIGFTAGGDVKILDFGVAKLAGSGVTATGAVVGTLRYMAPEQLRGLAVDRRADLWSLAVVVYEMLVGRPPFGDDEPEAVRRRALEEEPPAVVDLRPEVPAAVSGAVARGLRKRPGERPASAEVFAAWLRDEATAPIGGTRLPPPAPLVPPSTRLVGRERELRRLLELVETVRIVTLTGPGGAGKTRLALEAGHRLAAAGRDVRFVALADLRDPRLVASTVAQALALDSAPPGRGAADAVVAAVGEHSMVLLLDNLEHLPDAAELVAELVGRCPRLTVVTTSRGPLRLTAEHELPVLPLAVVEPSEDAAADDRGPAPAVRLFLDRARAALPDLDLDAAGLEAVVEICRRLDGLPLALELAAPRLRLFSPRQILEQLAGRIDLPGHGPRDHPERHRTLRRAIAWSYELLRPEHRRLFRALGVFRGGFTFDQAAEVTGLGTDELADGLDALVDQALLVHPGDGRARFHLLGLLRAFAAEELAAAGEQRRVRRAHRRLFITLAEEAAPALEAGDQREWIPRLLVEQDNLRAALDPALDPADGRAGEPAAAADGPARAAAADVEVGADAEEDTADRLRLAASLWRFWAVRGQFGEGLERLESLLAAAPDVDRELRVRALLGAATLAHNLGRNPRALELLREAHGLCRRSEDAPSLLKVLSNLGWVALEITELTEGEARSREALELARELGDLRGQAVALNNLGFLETYRERWDEAADHHRRSLALRRRIGDRRGEAFAAINLAWAERERGEHATSEALLDEADAILEAMQDRIFSLWSICHRASLLRSRGEPAGRVITPAVVSRAREVGNPSVVGELLLCRSAEIDDPEAAQRLAREAYEVFRGYGCPWGVVRSAERLAAVAEGAEDGEGAARWWREALAVAEATGLEAQAERARGAIGRVEASR